MTPGTLGSFRPALAISGQVVLHKHAWVFGYYLCCKEAEYLSIKGENI